MNSNKNCVLAINGGSSSIKFSLYQVDERLTQLFFGKIENIGTDHTAFRWYDCINKHEEKLKMAVRDFDVAVNYLTDWLQKKDSFNAVKAIGHRIVHGMKHSVPELVTPELLNELGKIVDYDPKHLPGEIKLIEAFQRHYPSLPQIACFDTSFHASMPPIAKLLSIPRKYNAMGIQRYGFHGLSYSFLMKELEHIAGNEAVQGRLILAHLGNGASLAAVQKGKCIDTSMGFTPTSGIPMGTRTGDLDPGVALYLMQVNQMTPKQFGHLINHESGLLGLSETSSDMRELLQRETTDNRAAEAIELFCYQTKKCIGAYSAVLGGLDTLVFSGGIGENAPEIRDRICSGLQFLGIELDEKKNNDSELIISTERSKVQVYVIKTNEELMIAELVGHFLNHKVHN